MESYEQTSLDAAHVQSKPQDYFSLGRLKTKVPEPARRSLIQKPLNQSSESSLERKLHLSSANTLPQRKIINKKNRTRFPSIAELKEMENKKMREAESQRKLKAHAQYVLEQQNLIPDSKGRLPASPPRTRLQSESAHVHISHSTWNRSRKSVDQCGFSNHSPQPPNEVHDDIQYHSSTQKSLLSTSY